MKQIIAANWKMNLNAQDAQELAGAIQGGEGQADIVICPPFPYLPLVKNSVQSEVFIGAQDCSDQESGAYTGQIAASMAKDCGCDYVILGHSERRDYNDETSKLVKAKAQQALKHGLVPIICVGETFMQREGGAEKEIIQEQLEGSIPDLSNSQDIVVAYEPVWAIGTGEVAEISDIKEMHGFIKEVLARILPDHIDVPILYGGSVKPDNAPEILATENVGGALVGGASLDANSFNSIINAALDLSKN